MLTTCPECTLPVSDKALTCPHCGYPLVKQHRPYTPSSKHKRLPNGFGQITKISNKQLRKPYRAMVTVGKTNEGKPIQKILKPDGYFETYNDAYAALVEYNRNPYDLEESITVKQLYEKWTEEYFKTLKSPSSVRTVTAAWAYCGAISGMRVKDVRTRHIKATIDNSEASAGTKSRIKSLFNMLLDYAVEYELIDRNYARAFTISDDIINEQQANHKGHISFTDEEMAKLWANINVPYVKEILVQCFMGWRPQELCLIEREKVDLARNIIVGGMKTEAGTGRRVPIHSCIRNFIEDKYQSSEGKYLFTDESGKPLTYDKYQRRFKQVIESLKLNPEHRAHDPRKQFVTMCKKYKVDEYAIKKIVGHEVSDITEAIYTDRPEGWLNEEIEKIKGRA